MKTHQEHKQRAGQAALHPLRNRALAMLDQQLPPIGSEVSMPSVRELPRAGVDRQIQAYVDAMRKATGLTQAGDTIILKGGTQ